MPERTKFKSHDDYISAAAPDVKKILRKVQAVVEAAVPKAERCIGYNMPAYRQGKIFLYFAAFTNHLGVYPPVRKDAALIRELAPYRNEKGNLAFKYKEPIPYALIRRVAMALAREHAGK
jgi:uncharacterized protein YdhG (YjbR/CyaY superfamily)